MATASNIKHKNGYQSPPPQSRDEDLKILVVGDRRCGKTTFIKVFHDEYKDPYQEDAANVYRCKYELMGELCKVFITELDGSEEAAREYVKEHSESNSYVLMYAIDDPSSFENLKVKWIDRLKQNKMLDRTESVIVVGNKMDLRENEQVIQRLAQNGQSPVTEDQGKSLVDNKRIRNYYDCSSLHSIDVVNEAWNTILNYGYADVIGEVQGYHNTGSNDEDPPDD